MASDTPEKTGTQARRRVGGVRAGALVLAPVLLLLGLGLLMFGRSGESGAKSLTALVGAGGEFTEEQKQAIQTIIKDYLITNPEVFLEIQSALEAKMAKDEAARTK